MRRQGQTKITDLAVKDRVLVQARVCKLDLANGAKPDLTAVRVCRTSGEGEGADKMGEAPAAVRAGVSGPDQGKIWVIPLSAECLRRA